MDTFEFIATTTFGLEAIVKREVVRLGFAITNTQDGRIDFKGGADAIPKANLWLRAADRVLLKMGAFTATTFDELFEQTKALPWEQWITEDGQFTVTGKSVKSKLFSVPDCQAIVKKAVVERLKQTYKTEWFEETGAVYKIQVALLKDVATLTIDTTGPGLHKRGYRPDAVAAPIKETLAAAMLDLSFWKKDRVLIDPFCGSGTIAIEAAMMAKNIAPGLARKFVSEDWPQVGKTVWKAARMAAYAAIDTDFRPEIYASDIDEKAIELAKHNARNAGVDDCIQFSALDFNEIGAPAPYSVIVTNPPYGERIGEINEVRKCYKVMGKMLAGDNTLSLYVITSDEDFEKIIGRRANTKRKLFNGMIKTDYYQYQGLKPTTRP